jgi:SAM-dependent methyltransferase
MRTGAFGESGLTLLDRLGNWLSLRAIRPHLGGVDAPYVLDLGSGYRARLLRALGSDDLGTAHAVDLRLDPSLKNLPRFITTEASIPTALAGLPSDTVDVLLLISVLEHLDHPEKILQECQRVIKPGGRMLINVPTWRGRWFLELAAFRLGLCPAEEIDDHKLYYDTPTLWPMLIAAGFKPSLTKVESIKFGLTLFAVAQKTKPHAQ